MKNQLVILGSGTCISSLYKSFDFRNPSGYLLQYNNKNLLLDCGEGIRSQLEKIKFDYFNLDIIFISHFHPDHFTIEPLIQSLWARAKLGRKTKKLSIYGPKNIEKIISKIWNSKHTPNDFDEHLPGILDLDFHEYKNGTKVQIDKSLIFIPYKTTHGKMDAYSMRFELGKNVLSYSGDTRASEGLLEASENADLFLCEATDEIGKINKQSAHLNPFTVGKVANQSKAKRLILVHYLGKDSSLTMTKEIRRSGFLGEITIAKDLDTFSIS